MLYAFTGAVLGVAYLFGFISCLLITNTIITQDMLLAGLFTAAGFASSVTLFVALLAERAGAARE